MLDTYNVSWDTPGPTSAQSMPIGNGDTGLNVWVEANGDLVFYIGKTDAWDGYYLGDTALMKLGRVRVSLNPRPALTPFAQVLKLRTGEIEIREDDTTLRVWVDANNPVIRVEVTSPQPVSVTAALNNWRAASSKDVTVSGPSRLLWYHRNASNDDSHVANLTFGAAIKGPGMTAANSTTLVSPPTTSQVISIYPLTAKTSNVSQWQSQLDTKISQIEALDLEQTRTAHQAWWDQFWHRSWVFIRGGQSATDTTRGYILQRFVTACAGRGAYPIKFNGSIFNVDNAQRNADSRAWGGQYWFQNTRPMYWPRLMAGDFDMMLPLFNMYKGQLAANAAQVTGFYGHGGSYFAETAPFWGGLSYQGPDAPADWTGHYFTPILELSMMMLDYYEYTGDATFAQNTAVPVAAAGIQFFDQHFPRDAQGKLLLDPDNSIEQFWKVKNPAPDIAGLRAVLTRMIALPSSLASDTTRASWSALLQQLPPLPTASVNGTTRLLPYTGPQTAESKNGENPELYAIYPFRLYGLGKPDFQLALDTFNARAHTQMGCWAQDPIQAAMLGLSTVAKSYVNYNLTRQDPAQKFPAFWIAGNDYQPDEDNGGNGENGLQQMLMQVDGRRIFLLPAWPAGWEGDFKLNAPFQTTVQGTIVQGQVTNLVVTPPERAADVIDMSRLTPVNLAANKAVTASSVSSGYPAENAVDGVLTTRWASASSNLQWIYVDLGAVYPVTTVVLNWEAAYAKSFKIQVSTNASTWTDVYSTTSGTGGTQTITFPARSARYVRMNATERGTIYGYSLWEFEVQAGPVTPAGLAAEAGNTQASLSWNASAGAASYKVKRATTSGGPYATIAAPTTPGYADSGLANGTTYYYVVSSVNSSGESVNSPEVSATPQGLEPLPPSGLGATAGNAQASLSWSAPAGATSYRVKRAATSGGPYTTIASPTTTSYLDSGLANGTVYYYVVSAVNGAGESVNSAQVSALPSAGSSSTNLALGRPVTTSSVADNSPGANAVDGNGATRWSSAYTDPQWISVDLGSAADISRVKLTWEAAYGIAYQIQVSPDAANWTTIYSTAAGDGGVDDLTGLSGSGRYVRVNGTQRATIYGYSLWEFEVYGSAGSAPATPAGLSAAAGNRQVALQWTAVPGATSYHVKQAAASGGPYTALASPASPAYTHTGLTNGTIYYYVVSAVNGSGESADSAPASAVPISPFDAWRVDRLGSATAGEAAPDADPDGDGRSNLLEYATGSQPLANDPAPAATMARTPDGQHLTLTFTRIADPELTYEVKAAGENFAGGWTSLWTSTGAANAAGSVTVTDPVSIQDQPVRFLRLGVSVPAP